MDTITQEQQTGLIKFEEVTSIIGTANDVLLKNENLVTKCVDNGLSFLDTIEGGEMSDELDAAMNEWQVKAKQALEIMNIRRSPITQMMTRIATVFTGLEAKIDPKKPDSVYSKVQALRNSYAKQKAEEQRKREADILKQQAIANERIELRAKIEQQVRLIYQNKLLEFKQFYNTKLNSATLETLEATTKALKGFNTKYPRDKFNELAVTGIVALHLEATELAGLIYDTRASLYDELSANFYENMEALKQSLIDLIPSKKMELEEIALADSNRKKQLEEAALQRQREEAIRLQKEADEAKLQDQQNIELKKEINVTGNLFEASAQLAEVKGNSGPVREGYKINVLNPYGYQVIAAFWFKEWVAITPLEKLEKKTLGQMKADCEKHAHANPNAKIISDALEYEETFKAVVTRG